MHTKQIISSCLFIFLNTALWAQTPEVKEPSMLVSIEGQLSVSVNNTCVFVNLGGPALKFATKKVCLSFNLLPSLKFENVVGKPLVTPILGFGPQFCFLQNKRFILSLPCYYHTTQNAWMTSFGVGYVLTKPKK